MKTYHDIQVIVYDCSTLEIETIIESKLCFDSKGHFTEPLSSRIPEYVAAPQNAVLIIPKGEKLKVVEDGPQTLKWKRYTSASPDNPLSQTQEMIIAECESIKELLLKKNREYGDSAVNPIRIFSSADPIEQINVRIDDKLSRLRTKGEKTISEDTESDLIGYLILRRVAKKVHNGG